MASPINIIKNDELLFEATNIQEAVRFLAEHLNTTEFKCYNPIERGYVYKIPYNVEEDEYRFVASEENAANRRKELEERGHKNARRIWLVPANPNDYDLASAFSRSETWGACGGTPMLVRDLNKIAITSFWLFMGWSGF